MKKSFGDYRLLANRFRQGGSLWLGPDHLLEIETGGFVFAYSENYRRIDFRNIQAITYARTSTWIWLSVVMGFAALACLGLGLLVMTSHETDLWPLMLVLGILAVLCLVALGVNLAKGPSCTCKLQTAVQVRNLRPVSRLRAAQRVVKELMPLCVAHQGGEPVTVGAIQASAAAPPSSASPVASVPMPAIYLKPPWTGAKVVSVAMVLLVISGLVTLASLFIPNVILFTANWIVALAAYVTAIAALTKGMRFELPSVLKSSLWGAVVVFLLFLGTAFVLFVWAGVKVTHGLDEDESPTMAAYLYLARTNLRDLGWGAWWIGALGAAPVFLGLFGLSAAPWPASSRRVEVANQNAPAQPQPSNPEFKP